MSCKTLFIFIYSKLRKKLAFEKKIIATLQNKYKGLNADFSTPDFVLSLSSARNIYPTSDSKYSESELIKLRAVY